MTKVPDATGHFGPYGGMFVPETLMAPLHELAREYEKAKADKAFRNELKFLLEEYAGRPTPLYRAERMMQRLGGAKIDRINLEFAYHGTGQVEDLKLLPPGIDVGMGVVDVRSETMQSVEEIQALAAAGARILVPQRIALNPDCGFAPDAGEPTTIDEAFEKLKRLATAAKNLRAALGLSGRMPGRE